MTTQQTTASHLIGFLAFEKTAKKDGFIGALLVTDNRGYPLEFRATTPVRPSLVQRTLYGNQLEHYVSVELCGRHLVQQSQRKPKVILVPERSLLDIAEGVQVNVVAIWRAGQKLKVEEDKAVAAGTIKSSGSSYHPVVYTGRFVRADQEKEILSFVEECHQRFDLIEAFERMRNALELLAKEDQRFL